MATPTLSVPRRPLTWLVTGSSSGLGLEIVRKAQLGGHVVIATSRNPSRTPELVNEIESKGGRWLKLDVNDLDSGKLIDDLESQGKHIDVLVNNAGYSIHQIGEHFTEEEVRDQMETLYFAPFRLTRAIIPHMRKRRFGVVVNVSSGAALEGRESMGAYAGAKAALDGLSRVLYKEVAPFNVRILTVTLGVFDTNFYRAFAVGKVAMDADYKGSVGDQTIQAMVGGTLPPDGDRFKAAKAIYEVVVGEGAGAGHESEHLLPLGRDMTARCRLIQGKLGHALEVFNDVTNNVYIDK